MRATPKPQSRSTSIPCFCPAKIICNTLSPSVRDCKWLSPCRRHVKTHCVQSAFTTLSDPATNAPWFSLTYLLTYL